MHRDYQGSILAITNSIGVVVEKRLFDVWGSLIQYANNSGVITVPTTTTTGLFLDSGIQGMNICWELGNAVMSNAQYTKYYNNFGLPIKIIKP